MINYRVREWGGRLISLGRGNRIYSYGWLGYEESRVRRREGGLRGYEEEQLNEGPFEGLYETYYNRWFLEYMHK